MDGAAQTYFSAIGPAIATLGLQVTLRLSNHQSRFTILRRLYRKPRFNACCAHSAYDAPVQFTFCVVMQRVARVRSQGLVSCLLYYVA
jgi:hypothetical protein